MLYKKIDDNQREIIEAAKKLGATCQSLASIGHGCPDVLLGYRGRNYLIEIKDGKKSPSHRRLTFMQENWHKNWMGQITVICSVDELIEFIKTCPKGE